MGILSGKKDEKRVKYTPISIWLDTDAPLSKVQPIVFGQALWREERRWGRPTTGFSLAPDPMRPRSASEQLPPEIDVQTAIAYVGSNKTRFRSLPPGGIWNVRLYEDEGICSVSMRWFNTEGERDVIEGFLHSVIEALAGVGIRATPGNAPDKYLA
jgi:hypothetical protein